MISFNFISLAKHRVKEYQLVLIDTYIIISAVPGRSDYDVYLRVLLTSHNSSKTKRCIHEFLLRYVFLLRMLVCASTVEIHETKTAISMSWHYGWSVPLFVI